jgi:hypothetical protein
MHCTITSKMRKAQFLIVLMSLIFCYLLSSCDDSASPRKGEISIIDARNGKVPEVNLAAHKKNDVEVYRRDFIFGNEYYVRYYQNENDTLRYHMASSATEEDFDKAAYTWLSDTSVSIRLYNTASKKEKSFKVFGYGSMNGMAD